LTLLHFLLTSPEQATIAPKNKAAKSKRNINCMIRSPIYLLTEIIDNNPNLLPRSKIVELYRFCKICDCEEDLTDFKVDFESIIFSAYEFTRKKSRGVFENTALLSDSSAIAVEEEPSVKFGNIPSIMIFFSAIYTGSCSFTSGLSHAAVLPAIEGKKGMVAADHELASQAGVEILRSGGNAVDAACAAAFVLGVVNPNGSGLGGGGFMLLRLTSKSKSQVRALDFRETAPKAAHSNMFLRKDLPPKASLVGGLAVGIPGELMGCAEALRLYGKLGLRRVLAPAIRLARDGFPVGQHLYLTLRRSKSRFRKHPALGAIFMPQGKLPGLGQKLQRPRLAKTLEAIADGGVEVFYRGWIAQDIVAAIQKRGGVITATDLATYKPRWRKPLQTNYRGYQIYTMPPPSSGGVAIIQMLNVIQRKDLTTIGHNSSSYLHLLTETMKHAFADRSRFLGDMDFAPIPIHWLMSSAYAQQISRRIYAGTLAIGDYGVRKIPPRAAHRDGGTSHISVADVQGNAVALTTTINTAFGSQIVAPKSGIILNNQMDDFTTKPGKPNAFGLLQSPHNNIAAGKRPLSSMTPTIVTHKDQLSLVIGGSGGPTIISSILQVIFNVVDFRLELNEAISRSRIHHQWLPNRIFFESDMPRDVIDNLQRRGHKLMSWPRIMTAVQAVQFKDRQLFGASDPRKFGSPAGY
jgi:gamma-glutamyltranspeptidase/glutathione hydrolase